MARNREMNMTEGPLLKKIILYALPLVATNVLQMLFHSADIFTLRFFAGEGPVAAVGGTAALINLIIGFFIGLSVGANVAVARAVGEGKPEVARKIVGTSVIISVLMGFLLSFVGIFGARTFLTWMGCDENVIDMATTYMQIYFLGLPVVMLYNFCASILRAVGDTVRPLIYLIISGVVNVGLNITMITVFHLDVEGVAIATITSQAICAVLALIALSRSKGYARLCKECFGIHLPELKEMARIGLPSGLQSTVFSLSNVLVQSAIFSFGEAAMAGNTLAAQYDNFIFMVTNAVALSAVAFVSQNRGACNYDRIRKSARYCLFLATGVGIAMGVIQLLFSDLYCDLMVDSDEARYYAMVRLVILNSTYFLCGIQDVMSNVMRGLGKSSLAMFVSIIGTCVVRIIWINTIFRIPACHNIITVYLAYPVSYLITITIYLVLYFPTIRKTKAEIEASLPNLA